MHIKSLLLATLLFFCTYSYCSDKSSTMSIPTSQMDVLEHAKLVNINSAHLEELIVLPGIGKKKAQAIIDYRVKHGNFFDLASLSRVKGIGQGILDQLKGKVVF